MLCERCKIREANIQYTEVINGVKTEHNLCAQCARELDFGPLSPYSTVISRWGSYCPGLLGIGEEHKEDKMHQVVCRPARPATKNLSRTAGLAARTVMESSTC